MPSPLRRIAHRTSPDDPVGPHYRWVVLSNTTVAMLMATLNMSSVMIAMPAIFRGIHLDPLGPGNFNYLLWMLMGYMVVTAVLVVNLGRLGDMFGRVRMYNLGFVIFTVASIMLSLVWSSGSTGASPPIAAPRPRSSASCSATWAWANSHPARPTPSSRWETL